MDGATDNDYAQSAVLAEHQVTIGSEMRQVRKTRQLTLKQVAAMSGVSVSHLSAIERNATNPSIDVVQKIADALSIDADWFFARRPGSGPMERAYVVRQANRRDLNTLYGEGVQTLGLTDQLLSSSIAGSFFMGLATYAPQSSRPDHPIYQHDGEQHGYILEGALELQIGDEFMALSQGDSFSFPTEIVHNLRNRTDRPARLIWAISPIVIPRDVVVHDAPHHKKADTAQPSQPNSKTGSPS